MDIYLINTAVAKERLAFQKAQFAKIGLSFQRINAITIDQIADSTYKHHYYDWQRPLKKTEVACYFSHKKIWVKIIENNKPALILEDDAVLAKDLCKVLKSLDEKKHIDLVTLEVRARKKYVEGKKESLTSGKYLLRLYQDKAGAAAYILWPSGAQKLLDHEKKHGIALADAQLFNGPNLTSYQIEPAGAVQLDHCDYYGIKLKNIRLMAKSTVSSKSNPSVEVIFKFKRIFAQLKLAIKNTKLYFKSQKRLISLTIEDFHHD